MAGFMLERLQADHPETGPDLQIVTAGTHTIDGQPMGMRTRLAMSGIADLAGSDFTRHRSRQVLEADLERAELVVVMEADHVRFVRRQFPFAASRTATIKRLCHDLPPSPPELEERLASLELAQVELTETEDVLDPAGHDGDVYANCAAELWGLCQQLMTLL
jgi:protein-tyrosine-phosphatase